MMREKVLKILKDRFNASGFRGSQEEIISNILSGNHSLVIMPTGMGKSLCYQLPSLILEGLTIVISPLISLMKDQADAMMKHELDAVYINSSLSKPERDKRYKNLKQGKYRILLVSPERFRNPDFTGVIKTREVSLLAVDEAHCISQWGHDFRPDYSRIREFRKLIGNPVTVALTATATERVQKSIIEKLGFESGEIKIYNDGICRPNLYLEVDEAIDETEKFDLVYNYLISENGSRVVYFNLIKGIEKFGHYLDMRNMKYHVYHGKMAPEMRRKVQERFIKSERSVMLATNAFGMGINKSNIRMIVHAEIPGSLESYYQEIGRAGRDGLDSSCILIYCQDDLAVQMSFLEWENPDFSFIKNSYKKLLSLGDALNSYTYEDIQEMLVHKNAGDHRLQTVLNLFDRYGITEGNLERLNLKIVSDLDEGIFSHEYLDTKLESDRRRLLDIVQYARTEGCRRDYINRYFNAHQEKCGNCDRCRID